MSGSAPNPFMFLPPGVHAGGGGPAGMNPLQMLFGQGGLDNADPLVIEQLFAAAGMGGPHIPGGNPSNGGAGDEQKKGAPPASASTMRSLPRVKVTAYDIAANESPECSICLDDLVIGEHALRIPCGHMFHESCVQVWLRKSNECPVCRWELPTDDAEYERGRVMRMAGRRIRLRHTDLSVKTAAELRRFAQFIGVDVRDCLEKGELVSRISQSPQVQLIATDEMEVDGHSSPSRPSASYGRAMFSRDQLDCMGVSDLKAIAQRLGVTGPSCNDKEELLRLLSDAGLVMSDEEAAAAAARAPPAASQSAEGDAEKRPAQASPDAAAAAASGPPLATRSIAQLKQLARELGVSLAGCLEKAEIVQRISEAPALRGS